MIKNPILKGFNPDPSIIRVEDDYYIATSTFEWYPGVQIHHSKDLMNWQLVAQPLNRAELLDMRGNPDSCGIWAPCLSFDNGLFYLIYTDVKRHDGSFKDSHNYLTTCTEIDGNWSSPIHLNSSGFDPSLFHDGDKKWFLNMIWDYRPGHNPFGGILLQQYCHKTKKLTGPIHNIFKGTKMGFTEAPHLYKRQGYYYLLTAEGGTEYDHCMTFARSKNIEGPYEVDPNGYFLTSKDNPNLKLQRAGHGDIVETPDGEIYAVHLCSRPINGLKRSPMGRETAIQKAYWDEDGWLKLEEGGNEPYETVSQVNLEPHPWPKEPEKLEFKIESLPNYFQWLRTPYPQNFYSLTEREGFLRLYGKQSLGNQFEQALIARRQQSAKFQATTKIEFNPITFQNMAGLVCYYNSHKYHYLFISCDEDKNKYISIMSCEGDPSTFSSFPLNENKTDLIKIPGNISIYLRADVDDADLIFSWSIDNVKWNTIDLLLDYSLVSDEAGKGGGNSFTGAFIGMCCQDLSGCSNHADFEFFEYIEK